MHNLCSIRLKLNLFLGLSLVVAVNVNGSLVVDQLIQLMYSPMVVPDQVSNYKIKTSPFSQYETNLVPTLSQP